MPLPLSKPEGSTSAVEPVLFAGEGAKNVDTTLLGVAQNMQKAGADTNTIWQSTGHFLGRDGKWRTEIDDSKAEVFSDFVTKMNEPGRAEFYTLEELMKHDDLFAAYPDMRKLKVAVYSSSDPNDGGGKYSPSKNMIALNSAVVGLNDERLKLALLHEIQHAIQEKEGFAYLGWNPMKFFTPYGIPGEKEAKDAVNRGFESPEWRQQNAPNVTPIDFENPYRDTFEKF